MHTGLSPEWDRRFDEAFTDLVGQDEDLVRAEFTGLIRACWPTLPAPGPGLPGAGETGPGRDG